MHDQRSKFRIFSRRVFVLGALKTFFMSVLAGKMYHLQILDSDIYKNLSKNNRIKLSVVPANRGVIKDFEGNVIIDNEVSYGVVISKENLKGNGNASIIDKIDQTLGYKSSFKKIERSNLMAIQKDLSWEEILKISSNIDLHELEIIEKAKRKYLYNEILGHITGYVSKPNDREIKNSSLFYNQNFTVGKNGLERSFNDELTGEPGVKKLEVNSKGKFMRELSYQLPVEGSDIQSSIDIKLQKVLASNFKNIVGSAIVLNPKSGEVMAMYSSPSYDPNKFIGGISKKDWAEITSNPDNPLINKSISIPYPPGSTFKIAVALSILQAGISPQEEVFCTGETKIGNRVFRCWNRHGHGKVNFKKAITQSCNIYFYTYGQRAGIDLISSTAKLLGFGQNTGIELPFENPGLMPNKQWKMEKFSRSWIVGDTINSSIGQGYTLTTQMQIVTSLARVVTGKKVIPTILKSKLQDNFSNLDISKNHLSLLQQSLFDVFNNPIGTGYKKRILTPGFEMLGKTGTSQVAKMKANKKKYLEKKFQDHGLFVGYLTNKNFLISTIYEHGGWGSSSALPLAINIIKEYFDL